MLVSSAVPTSRPVSSSAGRQVLFGGAIQSRVGPLLPSDVRLIRAATGVDFDWPQEDGKSVPEAALEIAAWRTRQAAAGLPWNKNLTPSDLQALHRLGIISQDFLDEALDYLSQNPDLDAAGSTSSGGRPAASTSPPTAQHVPCTRRQAFYL